MKIQIDLSKSPEYSCPSFHRCSFNNCPLAKKPNKYQTLPEDKLLFDYKKCRCQKKTRMEIAKAFNLKSLGLTLRELSSMKQSIRMKQEVFSTRSKKVESPEMATEQQTLSTNEQEAQ